MDKSDLNHITAAEAKERLRAKLSESPVIIRFMEEVGRSIENRSNSFNFTVGSREYLSDQELAYLKSLGYELSWHKFCLYYEVSWPIN